MNIVFMGTPEIANPILEALDENYNVTLVVTQEDKKKGRGKKLLPPPVKVKAEELGIPVFQPKSINTEESIEKLKSENADLFIVIAYGQILKEDVLNIPKQCINIHASILPKLRGAAPINWAIINGEKESGVSIMQMERGLDSGDVALVKKVNIESLNAEELESEISRLGAEAIVEFIESYKKDEAVFVPQNHDEATYAPKIDKETGYINFKEMNTKEILDLVRGLYPAPAASAVYKDIRFKILEAKEVESEDGNLAGEILDSNKKLIVKTKDSAISIEKIQFPGKKAMNIKSYLAGNDFEEKIILE
ncbi:methionyl-tRNA formyltransferase [Peptoniphilus stercorisuis]|uniref:Methionyl-tRNA formyltransferase n=1 Tax=Peptoniphilus stercorisuis TaxID=1436965 RepID=A0ABS4KDL0_9FIRM|nr:methionyl-tRNA formyltransferase [Peptoniphilus stercorisuis]MBP2025848.1 methionyl-tRNA formyltransferase [Peptoniphilus stercorisuis]